MVLAIIYSAIAGSALIIGAALSTNIKFSQRAIASIMAFGSGVLICAISTGLMEEAFVFGSFDVVIIGFLLGGAFFIAGDYWLHKVGARRHKKIQRYESENQTGRLISFGAILDGLPESIALGIVLFYTQSGGVLLAVAIFLSNLPESMSAVSGLKKEGYNNKQIYLLWIFVGVISVIITVLSYRYLNGINPNITGLMEAFAAGSILAMLSVSMIPEAFSEGGFSVASMTVLGFLTAFVISKI